MKSSAPGPRTGDIQLEQRAALSDRRERMVFVVLRNLIPILGILFLGWSAQNLILLYFVDTLGAMWAVITAMALYFMSNEPAASRFQRIYNYGVGLFAGAFLVVFLAIPLGMPLFIYTQITDLSWQDVLADQDFIYGLVLIGALALIGMMRHYQHISAVTIDKSTARDDFGILMTRWIIVLILIYFVGFLLGPYGAYVMVFGYVAATVYSEIYPERFLRLFGRNNTGNPSEHTK